LGRIQGSRDLDGVPRPQAEGIKRGRWRLRRPGHFDGGVIRKEIEGKPTVARPVDLGAEIGLVPGKNEHLPPRSRNADVPLLVIRRWRAARVREEDRVHGFALGCVAGGREAAIEHALAGGEGLEEAGVGFDRQASVRTELPNRHEFAIGKGEALL